MLDDKEHYATHVAEKITPFVSPTYSYVTQDMKTYLILIPLLFSASALCKAEPESDVYQVTLIAQQSDMRIFICISDECQKALSYKEIEGEYIYDFGTFPVPNPQSIELGAWRYHQDLRRMRRARKEYAADTCSIASCGSFSFIKANGPATSTTDTCAIGLGVCHKDRIR